MKLNNFLVGLVIFGIILLIIFSFYQIFLKPPEIPPHANVTPIDNYYGDDVFQAIK